MPAFPEARREDVQKTLGGISYPDPYAWLQEDSEEALAYGDAQSAIAVEAVRSSPQFEAICRAARRYSTLYSDLTGARFLHGRHWFWVGEKDGERVLLSQPEAGGEERVLASDELLRAHYGDDQPRELSWFAASPKGSYVAFAIANKGEMVGTWHVADRAAGIILAASAPAINYSGGRPGWLPNESGFYVGRRNDQGGAFLQFVAVKERAATRPDVSLSADLVPANISGITPQISPDGRQAVIGSEPHEKIALALVDLEAGTARPFLPTDYHGECDGGWLDDETYAARVNGDAPRGRVVAIPVARSQDKGSWHEVVPAGEGVMRFAGVNNGRIVVGDLIDVSFRLRIFEPDGSSETIVPLENPGASTLAFIERSLRPSDALVFSHATFTRSSTLYRYDFDRRALEMLSPPLIDFKEMAVESRFATSKDGTQVPYFVVRKKDTPGGVQPTLINAYGGFNAIWGPRFIDYVTPFVLAGGVYVQACLRGGGEYGRDWYEAGRLANKQNVFDDLFAVAEDLIARGETAPDRLAMQGASNGRLLAGVAIVQRPDLWKAVVPQVPLFEMMEPLPITPETAPVRAIFYEDYGDPQKPKDAARIFRWSPLQNVREGTVYPAVFQIFGEHDLGCLPFHGRKFTAALQHATSADAPIYYRLWKGIGHGAMDPATGAEQQAEWLTFVMDQIGLHYEDENQ